MNSFKEDMYDIRSWFKIEQKLVELLPELTEKELKFYNLMKEVVNYYDLFIMNKSLLDNFTNEDKSKIQQKVKSLAPKLKYNTILIEDPKHIMPNKGQIKRQNGYIFFWENTKYKLVNDDRGFEFDEIVNYMLGKDGHILQKTEDTSYIKSMQKLIETDPQEYERKRFECVDGIKRVETRYTMFVVDKYGDIIRIVYSLSLHEEEFSIVVRIITVILLVEDYEIPKEIHKRYNKYQKDQNNFTINENVIPSYLNEEYRHYYSDFDTCYNMITQMMKGENRMIFQHQNTKELKDFSEAQFFAMNTYEASFWYGVDDDAKEVRSRLKRKYKETRDRNLLLSVEDRFNNFMFDGYYCKEDMNHESYDRIKEYYKDNSLIFNECVLSLKAKLNKGIHDSLYDCEEYRENFVAAYDAIAYGHPQEEVREKMAAMFGDEVLDKLRK